MDVLTASREPIFSSVGRTTLRRCGIALAAILLATATLVPLAEEPAVTPPAGG